jgi:glycosyltransferase involved in cell wall biosynthesis
MKCLMVAQDQLMSTLHDEIRESDFVICALEGANDVVRVVNRIGARSIAWLHSATPNGVAGLTENPDYILCTSEYVRKRVLYDYGRDGIVFYPPFEVPMLPTVVPRDKITLVNPVKEKGQDLFLALARSRRDLGFLAVEGWYPVEFAIKGETNVEYLPQQEDMSAVYSRTKILLVPSQWDEPFGRVVVEAGFFGIPVIASDRGGLAEAVGSGGILLKSNDTQEWLAAISRFEDPAFELRMKAAAKSNAARFLRNVILELEIANVISR